MAQPETYPLGPQIAQAAFALGLDPGRVLRRAGLPPDILGASHRGLSAAQFYALWRAVEEEGPGPDLPLMLGQALARGTMMPAVQGFACSPDIETGFNRLATFKPLVAPISLGSEFGPRGLTLRWAPLPPGTAMPPLLALFELVHFIALCRHFTGHAITPLALATPEPQRASRETLDFLGAPLTAAALPEMRLSREDARRPMLFANEEQYRQIEAALRRQFPAHGAAPLTARVRRVLVEMLPAGDASVDAVCARLALSRRTLQRRLRGEGQSFQSVLDDTRAELSLHYLRRDDLSVQEIAYLLAYRDPNSFYRAFHGWTGMTPGEARAREPAA